MVYENKCLKIQITLIIPEGNYIALLELSAAQKGNKEPHQRIWKKSQG